MWDARNPRWLLVGFVIVGVSIQFFPAETTNPPEDPTQTIEALTEIPAEIKTTLDNACMDCHSYRTRWPWYSKVAPVSWLVADDIKHAREHFNFSTWGKLSLDDIDHTLDEMCEEVEGGTMPLASYQWMHSDARLTESQVFALCDWTMEERGRIRAAAVDGLPKEPGDSKASDADGHDHMD